LFRLLRYIWLLWFVTLLHVRCCTHICSTHTICPYLHIPWLLITFAFTFVLFIGYVARLHVTWLHTLVYYLRLPTVYTPLLRFVDVHVTFTQLRLRFHVYVYGSWLNTVAVGLFLRCHAFRWLFVWILRYRLHLHITHWLLRLVGLLIPRCYGCCSVVTLFSSLPFTPCYDGSVSRYHGAHLLFTVTFVG